MIEMLAYCDGSSFTGAGSGAGVVIFEKKDQELVPYKQFAVPLPPSATNNEAEYHAVIAALEQFLKVRDGNANFTVFSDSELVIRQINGEYKARDEKLIPLLKEVFSLITELDTTRTPRTHSGNTERWALEFKHVPRAFNEIADKLARIGSMLSPTHSNG